MTKEELTETLKEFFEEISIVCNDNHSSMLGYLESFIESKAVEIPELAEAIKLRVETCKQLK